MLSILPLFSWSILAKKRFEQFWATMSFKPDAHLSAQDACYRCKILFKKCYRWDLGYWKLTHPHVAIKGSKRCKTFQALVGVIHYSAESVLVWICRYWELGIRQELVPTRAEWCHQTSLYVSIAGVDEVSFSLTQRYSSWHYLRVIISLSCTKRGSRVSYKLSSNRLRQNYYCMIGRWPPIELDDARWVISPPYQPSHIDAWAYTGYTGTARSVYCKYECGM